MEISNLFALPQHKLAGEIKIKIKTKSCEGGEEKRDLQEVSVDNEIVLCVGKVENQWGSGNLGFFYKF